MNNKLKITLVISAAVLLIILGVIAFVSQKVDNTTENIKEISNSKAINLVEDVMENPEEKGEAVGTFIQKVKAGYDSAFHKNNSDSLEITK